jgi:ABC-type transport system involved in cytochrome bd biosynthesis fused ATPase/permease subunit
LHNLTNNGITPGPVEQEVDTSISNVIPLTSFNPIHATVATAERHFELKDINVLFPPGKLSVITGRTASGKTALLLALLGEMYTVPSFVSSDVSSSDERSKTRIHLPKRPWILDPTTRLHHCPSYAAQTPWLENISIKDNILFGSHYDEDRYQAVLECCALELDLATFEDGDETEIGERGITLSGGQKARYVSNYLLLCFRVRLIYRFSSVALARAVYAFTKYVLLDDPLSAVVCVSNILC